jgi:hypothetical protein
MREGEQRVKEREGEKGNTGKNYLKGSSTIDLLPPFRPHLLKVPVSPKTVPEPLGGHFKSKP